MIARSRLEDHRSWLELRGTHDDALDQRAMVAELGLPTVTAIGSNVCHTNVAAYPANTNVARVNLINSRQCWIRVSRSRAYLIAQARFFAARLRLPMTMNLQYHSVCVVVLAASRAFRPRARALKVRELTRSSKSTMSLRLALGMPCVMNTIRVRRSLSGQRSSHVTVCRRCCAP